MVLFDHCRVGWRWTLSVASIPAVAVLVRMRGVPPSAWWEIGHDTFLFCFLFCFVLFLDVILCCLDMILFCFLLFLDMMLFLLLRYCITGGHSIRNPRWTPKPHVRLYTSLCFLPLLGFEYCVPSSLVKYLMIQMSPDHKDRECQNARM